jgi:hypothetical protein
MKTQQCIAKVEVEQRYSESDVSEQAGVALNSIAIKQQFSSNKWRLLPLPMNKEVPFHFGKLWLN